jgi:hypothetical protein
LAIAAAVLVDILRRRDRRYAMVFIVLLVGQSLLMTGTTVAAARDASVAWDWQEFYDVVSPRLDGVPQIAYLGLGVELNTPQLEYPWALRDEPVAVLQLPVPAAGEMDWAANDDLLKEINVIVTVPGYGDGVGANRFNAALAERLASDERFDRPLRLALGPEDQRTDVLVFLRASAASR